MKVVEETQTRLVIKHRPIVNWILGIALFTIALFNLIPAICFDFNYLSLTCTRSLLPEINCELKKFTFMGSMEEMTIFAPEKAYIQPETRNKNSQVIIVNKLRKFPLFPDISYKEDEIFIDKFNSFINSRERFLSLNQNNREYYIFSSVWTLIVLVTGIFLATTPATTCTFDKNINKVLIQSKKLRINKVVEYPLEEIIHFYVKDKRYRNSTISQAVISIKDAKEIPINPQYTDKRSVENAVARIRHFLNTQ